MNDSGAQALVVAAGQIHIHLHGNQGAMIGIAFVVLLVLTVFKSG